MPKPVPKTIAKERSSPQQGFTLIETIVSLLILFAALSGIIPLYVISRLQVIEGEIETGAIAVSQQVLDNLRQESNALSKDDNFDSLPDDGVYKFTLPSGDNFGQADDEDNDATTISHMGKHYSPGITYCEGANASFCDDNTRHITIRVNLNGETVYETETIYTKFDQ